MYPVHSSLGPLFHADAVHPSASLPRSGKSLLNCTHHLEPVGFSGTFSESDLDSGFSVLNCLDLCISGFCRLLTRCLANRFYSPPLFIVAGAELASVFEVLEQADASL